jgi:hypothetical protein
MVFVSDSLRKYFINKSRLINLIIRFAEIIMAVRLIRDCSVV